MKKIWFSCFLFILVITLAFVACGLDSKQQAPSSAEKSQNIKDQVFQIYAARHQDSTDDPLNCVNGSSVEGSIAKTADIQEIGVKYDPETGNYTLETKLAELNATTIREYGSDPTSIPYATGGHIFWIEGTPRDSNSEWLFDRIGNNSFNYMVYEDGAIEFFRYYFNDPEVGWEEVLGTSLNGSTDNDLISMTIPHSEILPEGMDPDKAIVYWMAASFDGTYCDGWGIDENAEPNQTLKIDVITSF